MTQIPARLQAQLAMQMLRQTTQGSRLCLVEMNNSLRLTCIQAEYNFVDNAVPPSSSACKNNALKETDR
ncbi:hypothetical protein [Pseudomonas sp. StFLB209]|uniref:hypothetical protein n=1 Tax=Pseudomonas sp. StFLB209 TaxID=1028989 RepID=UPI0005EE5DFF|nr:hypothetical protein [Pseudomonas sp. StFLB209]